jgi:hypothetical protein
MNAPLILDILFIVSNITQLTETKQQRSVWVTGYNPSNMQGRPLLCLNVSKNRSFTVLLNNKLLFTPFFWVFS